MVNARAAGGGHTSSAGSFHARQCIAYGSAIVAGVTPNRGGEKFEAEGPVSHTLYAALLFLHLGEPAAVLDALRRRAARLDELIAKLGPVRERLLPVTSTGSVHLLDHIEKQRRYILRCLIQNNACPNCGTC